MTWRGVTLIVVTAVLAGIGYLALSSSVAGLGFPLDDSWIHQTYARNVARTGTWSYVPGEVSTGSTSPLWTILLALGYLLRIPYLWWAYGLGIVCLVAAGLLQMQLWSVLWPAYANRSWLPGVVLVLTWPFVWAAVSGMETLLFIVIMLALLWLYVRDGPAAAGRLGILGGLLLLTRPDGLLLVGLTGLGLSMYANRVRVLFRYLLPLVLFLGPYLLFNWLVSGTLWPNTFYAKQAEYVSLLQLPLGVRFLDLLYVSLGGAPGTGMGITGVQLLLVPGIVFSGWRALRSDLRGRRLLHSLPLLFAIAHILLYAWRLPVTYQHGRYLWPVLAIWLLYGVAGWLQIFDALKVGGRSRRILQRVAVVSFFALLFVFLLLGGQAYTQDVAFIENEMVRVAEWLQAHTAPSDLIAAHDIGAIGYFVERPLLDLAGLISPEVVQYLGNETALADYVSQRDPDFLVTAPGWPYELLTSRVKAVQVFSSEFEWTLEQGVNNTEVYRLP